MLSQYSGHDSTPLLQNWDTTTFQLMHTYVNPKNQQSSDSSPVAVAKKLQTCHCGTNDPMMKKRIVNPGTMGDMVRSSLEKINKWHNLVSAKHTTISTYPMSCALTARSPAQNRRRQLDLYHCRYPPQAAPTVPSSAPPHSTCTLSQIQRYNYNNYLFPPSPSPF